jgi:NAD(P)-dependent dehydrogenase (short-subunit alcohol dehydrogenase family)
VTGCSKGIGMATALVLGRAGHTVHDDTFYSNIERDFGMNARQPQ